MDHPAPRLFLLGVTHHTASLELRERFALPPDRQAALVAALRSTGAAQEVLVLNTCNRVELYGVSADPALVGRAAAELCRLQQIDPRLLESGALRLADGDAVQHLFEVAAGLDSQMVGETEILGQVKDAYAKAQGDGTLGPVLNRVFQKAFQSAKLVRSETAIGEGQVSVATVAVGLAGKIFGDLARSRALVVGAGDIAEKTVKALRSRGVTAITIANRTLARAEQMAAEFGGAVVPFERMGAQLHEFDVALCSTSSPDLVLTAPMVYEAMRRRPGRPLFLIDLALPRDIDPAAASLPNVFLYNLDDLARIVEENVAQRRAEIQRGRALLAERAAAVWRKVAGEPGRNGVAS